MFKNSDFEEDYLIKVVDFGIAGVGGEKVDTGTLMYMAPECLERIAADTAPGIDVWAIGVMFYAMLFGTLPFRAEKEKLLIQKIKTDPVEFPKDTPVTDGAKDAILKMLEKDPE